MKTLPSIDVTLSGILIELKFVQNMKVLTLTFVMLLGKLIVVT